MILRKAKKAPLTKTVVDGLRREADKAGLTLEAAIRICCESNWQSFKADWIVGKNTNTTTSETAYQKSKREQMERDFPNLTNPKNEKRHGLALTVDR